MKRLAALILVYGGLGFLTTVIIAWGFALRTDWHSGPRRSFDSGKDMLAWPSSSGASYWKFFAVEHRGVLEISAANQGSLPPGGWADVKAERLAQGHEVPSWSVMREGEDDGQSEIVYLEQAFGFPMLAMRQRYIWAGNAAMPVLQGGWETPIALKRLGRGQALPLRPIFPGALLCAALYGWVWYCVIAFPGIMRRSIRRWRKICPGCGYDLRHAQHQRCPECGSTF